LVARSPLHDAREGTSSTSVSYTRSSPGEEAPTGRPRCSRSYRSGLSLLTSKPATTNYRSALHDAEQATLRSTAREELLNISLANGPASESSLAR